MLILKAFFIWGNARIEVVQGNPTMRVGLHYVLTHEAAFCYMERGIFRDFLEKSLGLLAFITGGVRARRCAENESEMAFNGTQNPISLNYYA